MACVGKPLRWRIETAFVRVKRGRRSSMALRLRYLIPPAAAGHGRLVQCPPALPVRRRTRFAGTRSDSLQQTYCRPAEHRCAVARRAGRPCQRPRALRRCWERRPEHHASAAGLQIDWRWPQVGSSAHYCRGDASVVPASPAELDGGWRSLTSRRLATPRCCRAGCLCSLCPRRAFVGRQPRADAARELPHAHPCMLRHLAAGGP